jgi:hypothetical protein
LVCAVNDAFFGCTSCSCHFPLVLSIRLSTTNRHRSTTFDSLTRLLEPFIHQLVLLSDSSPVTSTLVSRYTLPTMADTYLSFLRSPSESALASDAALHYITTTTSIHESAAIIKHFQAQDKVVKKKSENVLSSFGTSDGAVVETDTTFEFIRGGGAILPQMDDNMLADSVASLPMVGTDLALTTHQV